MTRGELYQAMESIRPNCEWDEVLNEDGSYWFSWKDKVRSAPSQDDVLASLALVPVTNIRKERAAAYPAIGDQLDAIWKILDGSPGPDALAIRDAVAAVKTEYPKDA